MNSHFGVMRRWAGSSLSFVLTIALITVPADAAQKKEDKKAQEKMDEAQRQEVQALVKLVDGAAAGQPAPADFPIQWSNDFLKAQENRTYVPFSLAVDPASLAPSKVTVYVRVVSRGAAAGSPTPPTASEGQKDKDKKKVEGPVYPFEDVHFIELKAPAAGQLHRISRAFAIPGGDYDVYVGIRERTAQPGATPKTSVHKQLLTVPNFWTGELTTSTLMLADRVEPVTEQVSKEQQIERPYLLGTTEIFPAADNKFSKKEELSPIFLIYNPSVNAEGKPDVEVEYTFHQKTGDAEKYFNRTEPQQFNSSTLPPQFNMNAGHQVVAGQSIPLAAFPEGAYRLEIKITDKISGKSLKREATFEVVGS